MNRLQKNHLKNLKRKEKQIKRRSEVYNKTGRLKVRKRLEKEYKDKACEELLKKKAGQQTTEQGASEVK